MSHIFISYSRNDIDFARYLRALLENEGFPVWMDEQGISAGMNWWKTIERSIEECTAFLIIMSPDSDESMYVNNEILHALKQKKPVFPVLLAGSALALLATVQYEDMRAGLGAKLRPKFIQRLRDAFGEEANYQRNVRFEIVAGDVTTYESDVLVFKYAQSFHGADQRVAIFLEAAQNPINEKHLKREQDAYIYQDTEGAIPTRNVLYLATPYLRHMGYRHVREMAERALHILADEAPNTRHLAMTVHGVGFGLDEHESFMAQIGGLMDALQSLNAPIALEKISIVEINQPRVDRLRLMAAPFFDEVSYANRADDNASEWGFDLQFGQEIAPKALPDAGKDDVKPYAIVIISENEALDDIFYFGIQRPVHAMGLLCERMAGAFSPDITPRQMLERIGDARVMICDASEITPELMMQIGYAWGKDIPTLLLNRSNNEIKFSDDVLTFNKIWELEERLSQWLRSLEA